MAGSDFRPRVLTVDDNPQMLGLLRAILEKSGYEVESAEHGDAAWSHLSAGTFSLVITDLNMPRSNGLDLLQNMREQGLTTPAILLSGSLDEESKERASRLGRVECMHKPFIASELTSTIERLLK